MGGVGAGTQGEPCSLLRSQGSICPGIFLNAPPKKLPLPQKAQSQGFWAERGTAKAQRQAGTGLR